MGAFSVTTKKVITQTFTPFSPSRPRDTSHAAHAAGRRASRVLCLRAASRGTGEPPDGGIRASGMSSLRTISGADGAASRWLLGLWIPDVDLDGRKAARKRRARRSVHPPGAFVHAFHRNSLQMKVFVHLCSASLVVLRS